MQGNGTHIQKVVDDKDSNMNTVLVGNICIGGQLQYGQHARHACTGVQYTYEQLGPQLI